MLGKTANGLFWMYRYLERAENTTRLIETGQRIALTRSGASEEDWRSILQSAMQLESFKAAHDELTGDNAINWMLRDAQNPSSVLSSISMARQNARLVRTALTHDVWEAVNAVYIRTQELLRRKVRDRDLPDTLASIRRGTSLVRGMTHGTMLRNDIYDFCRIGTFLERADNTARILDVKYYVLLPSVRAVGTTVDNVQWETILRSVSALGGFRMAYGPVPDPRDIAQFLILDGRMPRSLAFCVSKIRDNLGYLSKSYGTTPPCFDMAQSITETHLDRDVDDIFDDGLHEFIQALLSEIARLGHQIQTDYRFND